MTIRPFQESDRTDALDLIGDARSIDSPGNHTFVAEEDGRLVGFAVWAEEGTRGYLGGMSVTQTNWPLFFRLAGACCQDAINRGFTRGYFTLKRAALLARVETEFEVTAMPAGWDPQTGEAVHWEIEVDLENAMQQLARFL